MMRFLLPAVCVLAAIVWWLVPIPAVQSAAHSKPVSQLPEEPAATASPAYLGMQSCSASACHGSLKEHPQSKEIRFDEYHLWFQDPHARAYTSLFDNRSIRMFQQLGVYDEQGAVTQPDRFQAYWQQCLGCHDPSQQRQLARNVNHSFVRDKGVGCEGCHGKASEWISLHYRSDWKKKSPEEKLEFGFQPTATVSGRALVCASCHVGDLNREVNHDLIAAGHPALKFELTWYEQRLPPHWNPVRRTASEPALEKWLAGQLGSARKSLEQLERRATAAVHPQSRQSSCWPELTEYRCFSCHHELAGQNNPQQSITKFPYEPWDLVLTADIATDFPSKAADDFHKSWQDLAAAMNSSIGISAETVLPLVESASKKMVIWQESIHADSPEIAAFIRQLAQKPPSLVWERDAQIFLALSAPFRKEASPPADLSAIRKLLAFPQTPRGVFDSPRNYLGSYEEGAVGLSTDQSAALHQLFQKLEQDLNRASPSDQK